jgi:hypothetical protein
MTMRRAKAECLPSRISLRRVRIEAARGYTYWPLACTRGGLIKDGSL